MQIVAEIRELKGTISLPEKTAVLVPEEKLTEMLGLSADQIKTFRLETSNSGWQEGIHFVRPSQRSVLYNPVLIHDWLINSEDPRTHQIAIERYLSSLPSNQRKSGRAA